jgi:hypothetical protein
MLRPMMHVWSKTRHHAHRRNPLELFQEAVDLRPWTPAPASGERRDRLGHAWISPYASPLLTSGTSPDDDLLEPAEVGRLGQRVERAEPDRALVSRPWPDL